MGAVANRESSPDAFVGQVLARSSPILTWRPALAARAADAKEAREISAELVDDRESSIHRISRAPTRRMVAWPVVAKVRCAPERSAWRRMRGAIAALVAGATLTAIGIGAYAWTARGVAAPSPPIVKVIAAHVIDDGFDTLVASSRLSPEPALSAPEAPAVVAAAAPAASPTKLVPPAAPAQRDRAHHGHRHRPSAKR